MEVGKSPVILNLAGELSIELRDYFAKKDIKILDPINDEFTFDVNYILTCDLHDFSLIDETYQTLENDIQIISLTQVSDMQNFIFHNGKMILNPIWLEGPMGEFILDKFFLSSGGITLSDNYPKFTEEGSFNVINPFNTGDYLDRLVHKSFEAGMSALSIKTFFDHLLMYLSGLKAKGKVGYPIEVTYGSFEEIYGVQFHFFAQNLSLSDVTNSVSGNFSKRAEEYLLNVAIQSCDFFDLSYIHDVNKVVVTALWTKDERLNYSNRGLMFTHLTSTNSLNNFSDDHITSTLISGAEFEDLSTQVVLGSPSEEESVQVISGAEEDVDDLVTLVKGAMDEELEVVKISGSKLDVDNFVYKVSSSIEEKNAGDMRVKSLGEALPQNIKTGLYDFARGLGKEVESLQTDEVVIFEKEKLPGILKMTVKSLTPEKEEKKTAKSLFALPPSEKELQLQNKIDQLEKENQLFRSKIKTVANEMKNLRENQDRLLQIKSIIPEDAPSVADEIINASDTKMSEREIKLSEELRIFEKLIRKLQIDISQRDSFFNKEIDKLQRISNSKDVIVARAKDSLQKAIEKKDGELEQLRQRMDQVTKHLARNISPTQVTAIRDFEKQNQNLIKMNDVYKEKISGLISSMENKKSDGGSSKDELRRAQMLLTQNKNIIDGLKKDLSRQADKANNDATLIISLKQDKVNLEQVLKKSLAAQLQPETLSQQANNNPELKKAHLQIQTLENQLKDAGNRIKEVEAKLQESLKMKSASASEDNSSKLKITHLETSLKKLTQDLVESRNGLNDMKKESNKLRQEKTALQNQLEKLKKDNEKAKSAMPKKTNGGKAA